MVLAIYTLICIYHLKLLPHNKLILSIILYE